MKLLIVFEMEEKLIPFWNNMKLYNDKRNETVSLVMVSQHKTQTVTVSEIRKKSDIDF